MIRALVLTLLLATPATAQIVPTGSPAADILLSQAIAEHRVFLTCSTLDLAAHQPIVTAWEADVAEAVRILADHKTSSPALLAFANAARTEALLPAPESPFADIRALCGQHPDWAARHAAGDFIRLARDLPGTMP